MFPYSHVAEPAAVNSSVHNLRGTSRAAEAAAQNNAKSLEVWDELFKRAFLQNIGARSLLAAD